MKQTKPISEKLLKAKIKARKDEMTVTANCWGNLIEEAYQLGQLQTLEWVEKKIMIKINNQWHEIDTSSILGEDLNKLEGIKLVEELEKKSKPKIEKLNWDDNTTPWMKDLENKLNEVIDYINQEQK